MAYHLPMIECSTCGNAVGHLYADYYRITQKLKEVLKEHGGMIDFAAVEYRYGDDNTVGPFLATYYTWLQAQKALGSSVDFYEPANVVARGLLRIRDLAPEHLPFGRLNPDGQRGRFEASICCLRMLHSDPSTQMK
jgi:hypothetical protein